MRRTLCVLGLGMTLVISGCGNEDETFGGGFNNVMANAIRFSAQPASGTPNAVLNNLQVQFVNGNQVIPVQGPITLTLSSNPSNAVFGGTTQASSNPNGVADFSNLTISKKGVYRITATAPGVPPIVSDPIVIGGGAVNVVKTSSITNPAAAAGGIFSVHSTDLNNDGNLDLISSFFDDNLVSVYLGNGTGGFAAPTNRVLPGGGPTDFTLGDWNGDGRADLAVPSVLADTIVIYLGDGAGSFAAPNSIAVGISPNDAATGDFNGDGTFGAASNVATTSANPLGLDVGDYNKDSVPDFAIGNFTGAGFPLDIFLQTP